MEKKVILITGCSSGLGKALCKVLPREFYYVVASARKQERLETVPADLRLTLDVCDMESIKMAVNRILQEAGRIDILVNNAGFSARSAVEELDEKIFRAMYEVNVFGMVRMMKAVLPIMRKQKSGRIINIGSVSGRMTARINGGYCSTKYAVEAITEAARYELAGFGIEICLIEPGAMDTEFFSTLAENSSEIMKDSTSPYAPLYVRDIIFRKSQSKKKAEKCAEALAGILKKRKLKMRYMIGVPLIYRLFIGLPDSVREWYMRRV